MQQMVQPFAHHAIRGEQREFRAAGQRLVDEIQRIIDVVQILFETRISTREKSTFVVFLETKIFLLVAALSTRLLTNVRRFVDERFARLTDFRDQIQTEQLDVVDDAPFDLIDLRRLLVSRLLNFVQRQPHVAHFRHQRLQLVLLVDDRLVDEQIAMVFVLTDLTFVAKRKA